MAKIGFHPSFKLPGRHTLARSILQRHEDLRVSLKKFFVSKKQRVSLTSDTWTSNQNRNYMALTAHYIDDKWKLQKKIISFIPITSHGGHDLADYVEGCLREWGIDMVYSITLDNASSNDVMVRELKGTFNRWGTSVLNGEYLHMRCAAHVINIVVTEGLKENQKSVTKIRGAVSHVNRSPARWKMIRDAAEWEKVTYKKHLWLDCPTRWNGAFHMLDRAVQYRKAFERYAKIDKKFDKDMEVYGGPPENEDWECAQRLVKFLEHFHLVTQKVSGSWYITSNIGLPQISNLCTKMKQLQCDVDPCIRSMATRMIEKFDKYWGSPCKLNMNLCFSYLLDPTCKTTYLRFTLVNLFGPIKGKLHLETVKSELARLYNHYAAIHESEIGSVEPSKGTVDAAESSSSAVPNQEDDEVFLNMTVEEFHARLISRADSNNVVKRTELDRYLSEEAYPYDADFKILPWWKVNSHRFPILSKLVKDVLVVPISTVASECAFSTGGRVISDYRSSLNCETVQALICAQDWIRPTLEEELEDDFAELDILAELEEEILARRSASSA